MQDWQDALLVYSTESGKIKPEQKPEQRSVSSDGVVRIHRETKGRKGKGVSLIKGLDLPSDELKKLGSELKKKCGCGGKSCIALSVVNCCSQTCLSLCA